MTENTTQILNAGQLEQLGDLLQRGSHHVSEMLAKWIGKPSVVEIHSLDHLPLHKATEILGADGQPKCFCISEITGSINGELILAFDDASGMALADILLDRPMDTTKDWEELAISAVNETTNILSCAYLNALSQNLTVKNESVPLMPTPPKFIRDFAPSLLQFALMGQAISSEEIILAQTSFKIDGVPANWTLLLVPDAPSMTRLARMLGNSAPARKDTD